MPDTSGPPWLGLLLVGLTLLGAATVTEIVVSLASRLFRWLTRME